MRSLSSLALFSCLLLLSLAPSAGGAAGAAGHVKSAKAPSSRARQGPRSPRPRLVRPAGGRPNPLPALAVRNQGRALTAYSAMQYTYYQPGSGLYHEAHAWPYSQAMAATISVAALRGQHQRFRGDLIARLSGLQAYADHADAPPAGYIAESSPPPGGGARFNDDNEWIGIELLRLYHLNHNSGLLQSAEGLLTMVDGQWDVRAADTCPGGVPWEDVRLNADRNTVSNATGAELGAQLFLTTHNPADLARATRMYEWVRGCLRNADGLYGDHVSVGGQVDSTEWTYNQGTMIGAGVMLYQATHDQRYLREALDTANAAMGAFGPPQLAVQPVAFNAIYIRNLLLLGGASGDPRYQRFAQWFADDAWRNIRDGASGLFRAGPEGSTQLLDQAAMVQVYALLAEPPSQYF